MNNFNFKTCHTSSCPASCEGCIFDTSSTPGTADIPSCTTCSNNSNSDKKNTCHYVYNEDVKKEPKPLINQNFADVFAFMIIFCLVSLCALLFMFLINLPTSKNYIIVVYTIFSMLVLICSFKLYQILHSLMQPKQ